ncbi:MAG: hypothetical protein IJT75_01305 [Bacteroidaceae bacterium]|nr:hypothetical protein [Bacteroidaceae bacterium]
MAKQRMAELEKEREETRKHNVKVVQQLYKQVENTFMSNYWSGDITQYMRREMFGGSYSKMPTLFNEALSKLK